MDKPSKELLAACGKLKDVMSLSDTQLEFMAEVCYYNKSMWVGDTDVLIRAEAKREIFLFLKSIRDCTLEELAVLYKENGEEEWIIKIMTQLTTKQ